MATKQAKWSDLKVRVAVLDHLDRSAAPLTASELSQQLKVPAPRVRAALGVLIGTGELSSRLEPGFNGRLRPVYFTHEAAATRGA